MRGGSPEPDDPPQRHSAHPEQHRARRDAPVEGPSKDHQAWEFRAADACLAALSADARRLATCVT
jgi:hypothetical protein